MIKQYGPYDDIDDCSHDWDQSPFTGYYTCMKCKMKVSDPFPDVPFRGTNFPEDEDKKQS
jgi:hypothetical protein